MTTHANMPSPKTMSTEAIIAEVNSTGPMLDAATQRMSPDEWVEAGHSLYDFALSTGKRLGDATREDLEAEKLLAQHLMVQQDRLADLYRELAERKPTLSQHEAGLRLYLASAGERRTIHLRHKH